MSIVELCNFRHSTHQVLIWVTRAKVDFVNSQKAEFCVVEAIPLPVWYYLAVFLIGFLILFSYLLNRITWLILLPFSVHGQFLLSACQSNDRSKSIPIPSKPSPTFAWWNTLHSQLMLKLTIICSKFVLVKMFIFVMVDTDINIYICGFRV